MNLFKIFIPIFFIFNITVALAQEASVLFENNGFRGVNLGEKVKNYSFIHPYNKSLVSPNKGIAKRRTDIATWYNSHMIDPKNPNFQKLGDAKILGVFVGTTHEKISQIEIITEYNYRVYQSLLETYGKPYIDCCDEEDKDTRSAWKVNNIDLILASDNYSSLDTKGTYYTIIFVDRNLKK
ncbi:hypothetical protein EH151_04325 [Elizabethkingia anophelis]|uniref:hypothetical protein n=1 Tax=Elizabethkingia anophelis TaxID=1117645 RepID=UPI00137184BB|nr:hypothetical protein [Elizabethkingia anophelis]MYZ59117.1 hypothetical protein [Elizabethkingia anophelis]